MKLRVNNVNASYEENAVLDNICIELNEGEFVSLVGSSGVGKTTLFNIIAGLLTPVSGTVMLDETDVTGKTGYVGYMLQKDMLLPYKTVMDNIALPLVIGKVKKQEARELVLPYMDEFGLSGYENKYPNMLSGGMRQRAALLRTYMQKKQVMLLDEPFSAIDGITRAGMHSWYRDIVDRHGLSTILITHDIEEAVSMSDRIYIMCGKPGKIVDELSIEREGSLQDFMLSEKFLDYKKYIIGRL
ncbi:MAG: ABC transporter ATP-binding protein [Lachnospiraceae bacterium]|nr:ABC transporter ATP-binding protein [Lachnospiraceae bacterium]